MWLIDWPAGPAVSWPPQEPARLIVPTAFHGALKHSDLSFVIRETLSSYVAHYLEQLRGWWVGRQANAQLEDNVWGSKESKTQRVHKMWIQFQGRIDDYGSRKPIKLNIHSSNTSDGLTATHLTPTFPQLFKDYTRKEQSYQECSHSRKLAARWQEWEVSNYHWEFIAFSLIKNKAQAAVLLLWLCHQHWWVLMNVKFRIF